MITILSIILYLLAIITLFIFTRIITSLIIALGQAMVGLILFKREISVYTGSSNKPNHGFHFSYHRLRIYFKYYVFIWEEGLSKLKNQDASFTKLYIFVLTGPFCALVVASLSIWLLAHYHYHWLIISFALFFMLSAIVDFIQNIIPNENPILLHDGSFTYNDGHILKLLSQYRNINEEFTILNEFLIKQQYKEGIETFKKINEKKQNQHLTRIAIQFYVLDRQFVAAEKLFSLLEKQGKLNSSDLANLGYIYSRLEKHEKALEAYNQSLNLYSNNFYALLNRAYTFILLEEYEEAIDDFNTAINIQGEDAYLLSNRGLAKIKLGKEQKGLRDIKKAIRLDSKNAYAQKNLGIYHWDKGEVEQALNLFKTAKSYDPQTEGIDVCIEKATLELEKLKRL